MAKLEIKITACHNKGTEKKWGGEEQRGEDMGKDSQNGCLRRLRD
jgi:hypothetical protein